MMKYNISKHVMGGLAAASLMLLTACNNAEYSPLSNQAYIAQTNTNGNSSATRHPTRRCRRSSTPCQARK